MNTYKTRATVNEWTPECRWEVTFKSLAPAFFRTHLEAVRYHNKFYSDAVRIIYIGEVLL